MRRNRYGGYRGRRTGRDILKYIIAALLVVIAVLAVILFLNRNSLSAPEEPAPPEQSQPQTPEQPDSEPEPEPELEPEPEPEPEPEVFVMSAVEVGMEQVMNNTWAQTLEQAGGNTVVVNMKPDDGTLNWDFGSSIEDSAVNAHLWLMNSNAQYTVARVSCFRDELLANTYEYCIHSNSGYRWKDFGGVHWVSPAHAAVQDRLIEQVVDLARLGFTEILLDNCGYPQSGSGEMGWIKRGEVYDPEHLDAVVGGFLARLDEALEQEGWAPVISIRANAAQVQENGALTGVTGSVLEEFADHIWLSEVDTDAPLAEILTLAGVSRVGERLVIQSSDLQNGASWKQAVLKF